MMQKINQIVLYAVSGIGVILTIMNIADPADGTINAFIVMSYILFAVAILAALGGAILKAVTNPKNVKGTLIGLGVLALITILGYVMASDEVLKSYGDISAATSRWSETGLFMLYIFFALAVIAIVYSNISKSLK